MEENHGPYHYGNAKRYDINNKYPIMWQKYDKDWVYFKSGVGQTDVGNSNIITEGTDNASEKEGIIWEKENENEGSMQRKR